MKMIEILLFAWSSVGDSFLRGAITFAMTDRDVEKVENQRPLVQYPTELLAYDSSDLSGAQSKLMTAVV